MASARPLEAGTADRARLGLEAPTLAASAVFTMAGPPGPTARTRLARVAGS
jgi:hypothetical protein